MTQTNNPLFDTILASGDITKRANPQVMDWTTIDRRSPRCSKSGYSCNMIIIDDVADEPPTPEQKASMLRLYQDHVDSKILSAFRIPETTAKAYALFYSRGNRKNITIPELKRTIDSVDLTTKEVQDILLNAGWEYTTSGTCPTKFFKPKGN